MKFDRGRIPRRQNFGMSLTILLSLCSGIDASTYTWIKMLES